ncbi:MAG: hypothetical protein GY846_22215 [Deltaproteobacteria bacterium]|nr:hypothetical protein [Deltaproteobacteria bacterium]
MHITDHANQNEGPVEGVLNKSDPALRQSFGPGQSTAIGPFIQQDSHETGVEYQEKTSFKDVVVSSLIVLSFTALVMVVYFILPS